MRVQRCLGLQVEEAELSRGAQVELLQHVDDAHGDGDRGREELGADNDQGAAGDDGEDFCIVLVGERTKRKYAL